MQLLLERFVEERPHSFPERFKVDIRPLTFEVRRNMGGTLYLLLAAVGKDVTALFPTVNALHKWLTQGCFVWSRRLLLSGRSMPQKGRDRR